MADELADNAHLNIAIDSDLLAEALAAVEKLDSARSNRKASPRPPADVVTENDSEELLFSLDEDADYDDSDDLDDGVDIDIELDDAPDAPSSDNEDIANLLEEVELLQHEQAQLQKQRDAAQSALETSAQNNAQLRKEILRARALMKRMRERSEHLEHQLRRTEDARAASEMRVTHLTEAHKHAKQQLSHLQKRRQQEKAEQKKFGHSKVVLGMLPVLDHLQMAIQHAEANPQAIVSGVEMVMAQFHSALASVGVSPVPSAPGTVFDPGVHEAILHSPTNDVPPGTIFQEVAAGYTLHGRLLRASRVTVAAALPEDSATAAGTDDENRELIVNDEDAHHDSTPDSSPSSGPKSNTSDAEE